MPVITLSEEQAKLVYDASETVEIQDPQGRTLARISPFNDQEYIERAKKARASNSRRFSSATVQAIMRALQEAADQGRNNEQIWELYQRLKNEASR